MPSLRLGSTAPDFEAQTTKGPIKLHEFIGNSWAILFSHPADFTIGWFGVFTTILVTPSAPVCTTELGLVAALDDEFQKRNVKPIGLSTNDLADHEKWIQDINDISNVQLNFPIIADANRDVATLYDMLDYQDPTNRDLKGVPFTVRSVFIIDPKKVIRLTLTYPASTGRNFDEILRVIDSLQIGDRHRVTTPGNWKKGDDVIVHPSVSNDEAEKLFPGYRTVRPYLRLAKNPEK
ncbi:thioredoxin-like protein [Jimgerdemannia flammicorona]|uniref:Thioredoxin-like protein n=2 Tax=Jimgerdemannia flammicorona TaxID=994334 RepID=A0A433D7H2_9FUNG|nr:thioredoxin-like protein [Jimgerdemannia flammicorona]RUS28891.1 thioredoxin-like protein [Jimgerdemannia flammicorona]